MNIEESLRSILADCDSVQLESSYVAGILNNMQNKFTDKLSRLYYQTQNKILLSNNFELFNRFVKEVGIRNFIDSGIKQYLNDNILPYLEARKVSSESYRGALRQVRLEDASFPKFEDTALNRDKFLHKCLDLLNAFAAKVRCEVNENGTVVVYTYASMKNCIEQIFGRSKSGYSIELAEGITFLAYCGFISYYKNYSSPKSWDEATEQYKDRTGKCRRYHFNIEKYFEKQSGKLEVDFYTPTAQLSITKHWNSCENKEYHSQQVMFTNCQLCPTLEDYNEAVNNIKILEDYNKGIYAKNNTEEVLEIKHRIGQIMATVAFARKDLTKIMRSTVDTYSGRFHHAITNLNGRVRRAMVFMDNEKSVELDVTACQPCILLNTYENETGNKSKIWKYIRNGADFYNMLLNLVYEDEIEDVEEVIYNEVDEDERSEFKATVLNYIYTAKGESYYENAVKSQMKYEGKVKWETEAVLKLSKAVKLLDVKLWEWIESFKDKDDKSLLPKIMQMREVEIFKSIWKELFDNNIRYSTIHDAIKCDYCNILIVKDIMMKHFEQYKFELFKDIKVE